MTVASYTDGNGLFSYTFSGGTNDTYRFQSPEIYIQASFVVSTDSPIGWETTIESDSIVWKWTGTVPLIVNNIPFTLSVYCSQTGSIVNENGIIAGEIYYEVPPSSVPPAELVGYNKFSYLQPIPEPNSVMLVAFCGCRSSAVMAHIGPIF